MQTNTHTVEQPADISYQYNMLSKLSGDRRWTRTEKNVDHCSRARFRRSPPPGWSYLVPYSSLLSSQALDWPCTRVVGSGVWDLAHPRTCGVRTWVRALDADGHCASARTCRDLSLEDSVARAKRYTRLTDDQVRFGARRAIRPAFCSASAKAPR